MYWGGIPKSAKNYSAAKTSYPEKNIREGGSGSPTFGSRGLRIQTVGA